MTIIEPLFKKGMKIIHVNEDIPGRYWLVDKVNTETQEYFTSSPVGRQYTDLPGTSFEFMHKYYKEYVDTGIPDCYAKYLTPEPA